MENLEGIYYWYPQWDGSTEQLDGFIADSLANGAYEIHEQGGRPVWFDYSFDWAIVKREDETYEEFQRRAFRDCMQLLMEYNEHERKFAESIRSQRKSL